jgi:CMP-N-acetylneuraminic acid synthetase
MFLWNLKKCKGLFDKVYVSSESDEVLGLAEEAGAIPIKRPEELCGETPDIPVFQHALENMPDCEGIVAVHADTPLVAPKIISMARNLLNMGVSEVMTTHPLTTMEYYKDSHYKVYGSVRAIEANKLRNYGSPYAPDPDVLLRDGSIEVESEETFKKALWLTSQ